MATRFFRYRYVCRITKEVQCGGTRASTANAVKRMWAPLAYDGRVEVWEA